jgi:hypothetical protein
MSGSINYDVWLKEIGKTNKRFKELFVDGVPFPPIFFFGDPEKAVAATLGVNPSAQEFLPNRRWSKLGTASELIDRCKRYFESPLGISPHPWFEPWGMFLKEIGLSYYTAPRAIHFDISPRATRSMGTLQTKDQIELFLSLGQNDLRYLVEQLQDHPSIKYLYAAGSITKKYYVIEFLKKYAKRYSLESVIPFERGGAGKIGLYKLDLGDKVNRYLFFCSTSPSSRFGENLLPKKAVWLKAHHPEFLP